MSASPGCWSAASSAATPPRRTRRSGGSTGPSASRVDSVFERQPPRVSFIDDERAYTTAGLSPVSWPDEEVSNNTANSLQPCSYCHQTRRLRTALKRIEEDYVSQIASLQARLHEAVVQRAAAEEERNEVLAAADAAAAGAPMMEQTVKALQLESMNRAQENEALRRRVQQLEQQHSAIFSCQLTSALQSLMHTEAGVRSGIEAGAHETVALLCELSRTPPAVTVVTESAQRAPSSDTQAITVATGSRTTTEAEGGGLCTHLFGGLSPDSSSPGPSEGSREHRTSSPRPSQRRSLSVPFDSQRLSYSPPAHELRQSGSTASVAAPNRAAFSAEQDAAAIDAAVQVRVKKLEWSMQQQRSAYEMELADERALTKEMQEEVDDLVKNELALLETSSRAALEREEAEALCENVSGVLLHQRLLLTASERTGPSGRVGRATASTNTSAAHDSPAPAAPDKARLADVAGLREVRQVVQETWHCVADLHGELADCHAAVEALEPRHSTLEDMLRQVLDAVTDQNRRSEGTRSALRRFSHVSTHNDETLMRSLQRLETSVATRAAAAPASAVARVDSPRPGNQRPTSADATTLVVSPCSGTTTGRGSTNSGSEVVLAACRSLSPAAEPVPSASPVRPSFVVAEEALFNPTAITVDTRAAAAQMASFLDHDALSDTFDEDVAQNPYDVY